MNPLLSVEHSVPGWGGGEGAGSLQAGIGVAVRPLPSRSYILIGEIVKKKGSKEISKVISDRCKWHHEMLALLLRGRGATWCGRLGKGSLCRGHGSRGLNVRWRCGHGWTWRRHDQNSGLEEWEGFGGEESVSEGERSKLGTAGMRGQGIGGL